MWSYLNRRGSEECWKFSEDVPDLPECRWRAVGLRELRLVFDFNFASLSFQQVMWAELWQGFLAIHKMKIRPQIAFFLKHQDSQFCSLIAWGFKKSLVFLKGAFLVTEERTWIVKAQEWSQEFWIRSHSLFLTHNVAVSKLCMFAIQYEPLILHTWPELTRICFYEMKKWCFRKSKPNRYQSTDVKHEWITKHFFT